MMRTGPIVIGYDGSQAAEYAVRDAGPLLAPRPALVVTVWEAGAAFLAMELPAAGAGLPAAPIDIRSAMELDQKLSRRAQETAQRGAELARDSGLEAEGLAVADDITPAQTLVRLARERDAQALLLGAHGQGRLSEVILGSTTRAVTREAPCPVVVSPPSSHAAEDARDDTAATATG
jgi:nucleotide-binding universal stress UspA family protein